MGAAPLAPQKPVKFRHSFWWYLKWTFYTLAVLVFCVFVAVLSIGYGIYNELEKVVPDTRVITRRSKIDTTRIYAADGKTLLAAIKGEDRIWKPFDELVKDKNVWSKLRTPEDKMYNVRNILKATLSIEDARFYTHPGMDTKRLVGALVSNVKRGNMGQGGSTITEQLAVNLYQSRDKSVRGACKRRCWLCRSRGVSAKTKFSNFTSTKSTTATAPTAARPRRAPISIKAPTAFR